jgi:hypothetical protein
MTYVPYSFKRFVKIDIFHGHEPGHDDGRGTGTAGNTRVNMNDKRREIKNVRTNGLARSQRRPGEETR